MSATGRSDVRRADDWYATPSWAVRAIWPKLAAFDTCLDPCAGQGAILLALNELATMPRYYGIEIDEQRATICAKQNGIGCLLTDALVLDWRRLGAFGQSDLIITNPPYSLAQEFLEKALVSGASQVCFLLRLNFLESKKRAAFWRSHPCDVWVLPKRPSFTSKGTDATGYAWFLFGPGHQRMLSAGKSASGCSRQLGHWGILDL